MFVIAAQQCELEPNQQLAPSTQRVWHRGGSQARRDTAAFDDREVTTAGALLCTRGE